MTVPDQEFPGVDRVKIRLMCLWANMMRAAAEDQFADDEQIWTERIQSLQNWTTNQLAPEQTEAEKIRHAKAPGTWTEREMIQDQWDREASVGLVWALRLIPTFPYLLEPLLDFDFDFFDFPEAKSWRPDLNLRPWQELEEQAKSVEACYWRIRTPDADSNATKYGQKLMQRAAQLGQVRLAKDGDLATHDGKSILKLNEDELSLYRSTLMERLEGLNWLTGQEQDWDDVTSDTVVSWLWDEHWPEAIAPPKEKGLFGFLRGKPRGEE
jgi:hypothetical protein